ncbi:hypothetical protein [Neptunitalea lumnitzerae]|uniref:DUF2007 domain-containing protein n=1 Tax=Neptunitalea lumnitzerae TaxID=2965509 RepID=A0ABQ5MJX8_9FLAO|nr:hypothetical protein [Neptunitalea sp. Y10]GLB49227.1 hypothetical protein Y10_15950 [Neptunitalea sp. Y10]
MRLENGIKVFTGTEITATMIKERLIENGIKASLEDDDFYKDVVTNEQKVPEKLNVYVPRENVIQAQEVIEEAYVDLMDN